MHARPTPTRIHARMRSDSHMSCTPCERSAQLTALSPALCWYATASTLTGAHSSSVSTPTARRGRSDPCSPSSASLSPLSAHISLSATCRAKQPNTREPIIMTYSNSITRTISDATYWHAMGDAATEVTVTYGYPDAPDEVLHLRFAYRRDT